MAGRNSIVKLAVDLYNGTVRTDFADGDPKDVLMKSLLENNGGSDKITYRSMREHPAIFAIMEDIITKLVIEGLSGDEFFMQFVESRNIARGDSNIFRINDDIPFIVADIADGTQGIRRQRLTGGESIAVKTVKKAIKIYEELDLLMTGRVDFNTFIDKVSVAFKKKTLNDMYSAFTTLLDNESSTYNIKGSADVAGDKIVELIAHVEAATGKRAYITGTKMAIRRLKTVQMSDKYKDDLYNMGYYGKFEGTPCVAIDNKHQVGSTNFILPNDKLWVIAGDDEPIKHVTEGQSMIITGVSTDNADLSQEFLSMQMEGIKVILAQKMGAYEFSA